MRHKALAVAAAALFIVGCGKDSNGPNTSPEAARAIARFNYLADSLTAIGDPESAQIFTGAADAVRMAGDVSTVSISVDGAASEYNALTLSLHLPETEECDEYGCYGSPAMDENLLLAWKDETDPSVMMVATAGTGTHSVAIDTTSETYEEPSEPLATGLAIFGSESGEAWFSSAGTATNSSVSTGGACARPKTETPSMRFTCSRSTYRWSANFTASEAQGDAPGTDHQVVIASANVSGARVVVSDMGGNLSRKIGSSPIRTRLTLKRDKARGIR